MNLGEEASEGRRIVPCESPEQAADCKEYPDGPDEERQACAEKKANGATS